MEIQHTHSVPGHPKSPFWQQLTLVFSCIYWSPPMCQSLFQAQRMGLRLRGSSPVGSSAVRPFVPQPPSAHPSALPFPGASEARLEDKSQTEAWNRLQSSVRRVCPSWAARGWGRHRPRVKGVTGRDPLLAPDPGPLLCYLCMAAWAR